MIRRPPISPLFPYPPLSRSPAAGKGRLVWWPPALFGTVQGRRENGGRRPAIRPPTTDRKSTRLNSSHLVISYAVFCLKKKKKQTYYCSVGATPGHHTLTPVR